MGSATPTVVTVYGRLSYPVFSYAEAVKNDAHSPTPKQDPAQVTPSFYLLLEPGQAEKYKRHILDVFFPYCLAQHKAGESKNALAPADVQRLVKLIESADWDAQPPYISFKKIGEKTQELAPDCVFAVKIVGPRGADIEQRAIVRDENELRVPDPDLLTFPVVKPIGQTTHQLYPGSYAAATLNLYSFTSGKLPGFSSSAAVVVFKADAPRFGGGVEVDEDAIFAD
jgi:hypothetical protein